MSLTNLRPLSALVPILGILASFGPAYADGATHVPAGENADARTGRQIELFSPRVRRATVTYLRLRMLELREEDLERARAAIEHRLSIDELLAGPRSHYLPAGEPRDRRSPPPTTPEQAQPPPRRSAEP